MPHQQPLYEELRQHGAPMEGMHQVFRTSDNTVETTGILNDRNITNSILGVEAADGEADDDSDYPMACLTVGAVLEVVSRYNNL